MRQFAVFATVITRKNQSINPEDHMELNAQTKLDTLISEYPFLLEFFINRSPKFQMLQNVIMRKTVGKVASLENIAAKGDIELETLLAEIAAEIKAKTI
jgi:uncharacterized protein